MTKYYYMCDSILKIYNGKIYVFNKKDEEWDETYLPMRILVNNGLEIPESEVFLELI